MSDLAENPTLRQYLKNVRDWHGYMRFLGLPDYRDNPDVLIDRLFVEPLLARRQISPDEDPSRWLNESETVFNTLKTERLLVILGDPGAGKSTLLNYLVWLLARPTEKKWSRQMGEWLLPVPMVLRELHLDGVADFKGLLKAFSNHEMCAPLRNGEYLTQMLQQGRALILMDGVDELGYPTVRQSLRQAVFDGYRRYPKCRWLLTSRIVGYDEVPFDSRRDIQTELSDSKPLPVDPREPSRHHEDSKLLTHPDSGEFPKSGKKRDDRFITRYLAPFDDQRIDAFARNWYIQRVAAKTQAEKQAEHLMGAIHADHAILRLARIPNLLTLMALIHRIETTLPHGRSLLYERISEAYLESIDKARRIHSDAHNLPQKRRWLARVGFEMQKKRSLHLVPGKEELLVESREVISWINEEIKRGGTYEGLSAEEFLDFVARRSGLFIPRSQGRYAFVHLSFQEYFAAVALEREVTGLNWARNKTTSLGLTRTILAKWAEVSVWHETFSFLFELLGEKEDWHTDLLDAVFGPSFSKLKSKVPTQAFFNLAQLVTNLAANQRSGITEKTKNDAITAVVKTALGDHRFGRHFESARSIIKKLLGGDSVRTVTNLKTISEQVKDLGIQLLDLEDTQVADLSPLKNLSTLKILHLDNTQVADLSPLKDLPELKRLDLENTQVADLSPLKNLSTLEILHLENTQVADLSPLKNLSTLEFLHLENTQVADLSPLKDLSTLEILHLENTQVADLSPLKNLSTLKFLHLDNTQVADLSPLKNLSTLKFLHLDNTQVADLSPLKDLAALEFLHLENTQVADLSPLKNLAALEFLHLENTQVAELSPLKDLSTLKFLDLENTQVADLSPLKDLSTLKFLDLDNTQVADLSPLKNLSTLEFLHLDNTQVADLSPLKNLSTLKFLHLDNTQVADLSPLKNLAALKFLHLDNTQVADLSPLKNLAALEFLKRLRP